jgi:hypothetical protein
LRFAQIGAGYVALMGGGSEGREIHAPDDVLEAGLVAQHIEPGARAQEHQVCVPLGAAAFNPVEGAGAVADPRVCDRDQQRGT